MYQAKLSELNEVIYWLIEIDTKTKMFHPSWGLKIVNNTRAYVP